MLMCVSTAQARTKCAFRSSDWSSSSTSSSSPYHQHPHPHLPLILILNRINIIIFIIIIIIIITIIIVILISSWTSPESSQLKCGVLLPLHTVWGLLPGQFFNAKSYSENGWFGGTPLFRNLRFRIKIPTIFLSHQGSFWQHDHFAVSRICRRRLGSAAVVLFSFAGVLSRGGSPESSSFVGFSMIFHYKHL